jgi:hypothetical protein
MILGISGRKQAGKNTTANILHGIILKEQGFVEDWNIDALGHLNILDEGGWGYFDVTRKDPAFVSWADNVMWPFVKLYSFADELKRICIELFDIPFECVYGTDEQKNQVQEHLLWENMPGVITCPELWDHMHPDGESEYGLTYHAAGPMTAREFMQFLGTDVMRKMYEPIWVNSCIKKIQREQSALAIIADVRFPNEAKAIEQAGGFVARLTRQVFEDNHSSEVALDDYPFKYIIENQEESIALLMDKVKEFYKQLQTPFIRNPNVSYIC